MGCLSMARAPSQGRRRKVPATNKGRRPKNRAWGENVFLRGGAASSLSWLAGGPSCFAGSLFLVPVLLPWLFSFSGRTSPSYRSFLSILWPRGGRVPAPGGRGRRGQTQGHQPQEPAPFRYPSTNVEYVLTWKFAYMLTLAWWFFFALFSLFLFFFVLVVVFSLSEVEPPRSYAFGAERGSSRLTVGFFGAGQCSPSGCGCSLF